VTPEQLGALCRETVTPVLMDSLTQYVDLVSKWTQRINLVSRSTQSAVMSRHVADSMQLWPLVPQNVRVVADLGSGGGFPGMVLAILSHHLRPGMRHILLESDQRKATFLREAARQAGVSATVICARIEGVPPLSADLVTARALAPLPALLKLATPHLSPDGVAVFPKGVGYRSEIDAARAEWAFAFEEFPSQTEPGACLLRLSQITPIGG
jgi:16S rRNA (guanine527-N7)-methyltransferase